MTPLMVVLLAASPISLDEVRVAARQNLQAVQAHFDVDRAVAGQKQARSAILPQVDLSVGARESFNGPRTLFNPFLQTAQLQEQSFFVSDFSLGLAVNQLLYDGGRWWSQIAQAGAQAEAARGQLDEQRLASELEAVRRFFELVRSQTTKRVLEASVDRSKAQLQRARSLYDAGRVQKRDVLDAEVNVGNDEIAVLRQGQGIAVAQLDLLRWLGQPVHAVEAIEPPTLTASPSASPRTVDELLEQARTHRPLLKALKQRVEAAQLGVTVANADNLPRVGIDLSYSRSSPLFVPFVDPRYQHALSGGVRVSWNLFSGFNTQSQVERARVEVNSQQAQQAQALVDLEAEVTQAATNVDTQLTIASIASKNAVLADAQLKLEDERYAAGAGSPIDVRNAQLKVTQAQLTLVQGRIDLEIARAALERALGTSLEKTP